MKYLDEFRDPVVAKNILSKINNIITKPYRIMEICGGQTHSIIRNGIDKLLPNQIDLVHGPGCPVCVTPLELIDKAIYIASQPDVIFTSFGDMLRVPGSETDLFHCKSQGGDVRIVYSPLDALKIAKDNPHKKVVFFAIGFETTAPNSATVVLQAFQQHIKNLSFLVSHVLVPPAIQALLTNTQHQIQGFLAAGHVCAVTGWKLYEPIAEKFNVPIIVTGFEPVDILAGIYNVINQLEQNKAHVDNQYARVVLPEGNLAAQKVIERVYKTVDRNWRGIGTIPQSGYSLRKDFAEYDAERVFPVESISVKESKNCISGEILQGIKKPVECPEFRINCTPQHPLGATMVSSEGACAAYYKYQR